MHLKVLLIDDDRETAATLRDWSGEQVYDLTTVETLAEARAMIEEQPFDLALVALELPDGDGLELVSEMEAFETPEMLVLSSSVTLESAVDSMQRGAVDYLEKPIRKSQLRSSLIRARRRVDLRGQVRALRGELRGLGNFAGLIGASAPMQRVYELIEQVAPTDAPVLLTGETGTGKELAARAIHQLSRRNKGDFVPLNCAAVPHGVIESELFGHKKGAFTGARRDRRGVFARADGGTLLLDEITEMPLRLQPQLLRVLEAGEFLPVGSETPQRTNFRLIASTNRDPAEAVRDGKLREDLLYRINVFPIELPPLREREGDAELIVRSALKKLNEENGTETRITASAIEQLERHDWPGNVRELLNAVRRAYIQKDSRIERFVLGDSGPVFEPDAGDSDIGAFVGQSIAKVERQLILATLEALGGNKRQTARTLGISLKTLYTRLNRYGDEAEEVMRRVEARKQGSG